MRIAQVMAGAPIGGAEAFFRATFGGDAEHSGGDGFDIHGAIQSAVRLPVSSQMKRAR